MKQTITTGLSLILFGIILLARRSIVSYFCNLADPEGGRLGNRAACTLYFQDPGGHLLTIVGSVALVFTIRATVQRRQIT